MLNKILHNKIAYLLSFFIICILGGALLLSSLFTDKIIIDSAYLYILHIISAISFMYIIDIIYRDNDNKIKGLFSENIFFKIFLLLAILIGMYFLFNFTLINYLIIGFIVTSIIFQLDSRISFSIALILLFYVVFYIASGDQKIAEKLSIYTYYFLVIGVGLEILSNILENKNIPLLNEGSKSSEDTI